MSQLRETEKAAPRVRKLPVKTASDPRHLARISAMKSLFSLGFDQKSKIKNKLAGNVILNLKKIDKLIAAAAPEWRIDKINRIDLAILRLAGGELAVDKKNPAKAVIDEAIEVAKRYGSESTPGFVNGGLGTIYATTKIQ